MQMKSQNDSELRVVQPGGPALLGRLMWMLFGPIIAIGLAYLIVTGDGWLTPPDAAFFIIVGLMVGGRWIEQRSGAAMTATGQPATVEHFHRYVRVLLGLAAGVWIIANVLANHILK